ncbi:MAG: glycerol kinase GlpK [Methanomicrobia archaeon]|nr:glycerol kinase GlpK [Methanomicrobia archaeon]
MKKYILVIDEGTTGVRSIIFDKENSIVSQAYSEIPQIYPKPGWIEQDPEVIWERCVKVVKESLEKKNLSSENIAAIAITNQRSTSLLWDKKTGTPIYNAITWQDTRTAELCKKMDKKMSMRLIRGFGSVTKSLSRVFKPIKKSKLGKLLITTSTISFTPASSLAHTAWILENVEGAKERAERGELLAGTIDTWLIWKLTDREIHATDFSNASATGMFDTFSLKWSGLFLKTFDIPENILPEVRETSGDFGKTKIFGSSIPITGVVADQQSSLFAETCFNPGEVKCTNGTGTFIDMNVGNEPPASPHKLLPLIAWKLNGEVTYMLEGYLGATGCAVQWLCDGLQIIKNPSETEEMADSVEDTGGVYVVPAFTGLTSPYWDPLARGIVVGLTRGTKKEHIVRATLEAIAYRCKDVLLAMEEDSGVSITSIRADGGASKNNFLLQFMADLLDVEVERPKNLEATSLGAAYLAGLAVGYWNSKEDIIKYRRVDKTFKSKMKKSERELRYTRWKKAVKRSFDWA